MSVSGEDFQGKPARRGTCPGSPSWQASWGQREQTCQISILIILSSFDILYDPAGGMRIISDLIRANMLTFIQLAGSGWTI